MSLLLFYTPGACSLVPYLTLTEAGADFQVQPVNMDKGEHLKPEYDRVNPKHKVPVLVIDGEPLTENVAIQIWIARQFPQARLLPSGALEEVRAIAFLAWCASAIHPALTPNARPQRYCDLPGSEDSVRRCAQALLKQHFTVAEQALEGRDWFFADHYTAADAYFYWCFRRASQFNMDLSAFPNCQAHLERMQARPSTQQLLAYEAEVKAQFARG